jgi:ferredoxin
MKVLFAYYTGTGNTRRALERVAERMTGLEIRTDWLELRSDAPAPGTALAGLVKGDLLVLGFPALGFSAPAPVIQTLRNLPNLPGILTAVLCSCGATMARGRVTGGWSGTAVPEVLRILRRKGAIPLGSSEASYPENWTQVSPPAKGSDLEAMIRHGDGQASEFGSRLAAALSTWRSPDRATADIPTTTAIPARSASGRATVVGIPAGSVQRGIVSRICGPLMSRAFRTFGRRLLARLFSADASCTACGYCVRTCPNAAIHMEENRPAWSWACSACNRCINSCPMRAIQTSWARLILVLGLNLAALVLSGPAAHAILESTTPASTVSGVASFFLGLALYVGFSLLQAGPLDLVLRALERSRLFGPLFCRGFTERFGRYLAPGFHP